MTLHRFWITFVSGGPRPGCGVTAHTYEDALKVLSETVFKGRDFPGVQSVTEDVDVSELDQKHVVPNMEPPNWRGVWYPRGFAQSR